MTKTKVHRLFMHIAFFIIAALLLKEGFTLIDPNYATDDVNSYYLTGGLMIFVGGLLLGVQIYSFYLAMMANKTRAELSEDS